ncbi:MAG: hypothetical protein HUK03_00190 [Bacteroidaceae bacterium]|nr:hypothetical protein [Bacteroidaceae bacterium]
MTRNTPLLCLLLGGMWWLSSCQRGVVLHSYQPLAEQTWSNRDTLSFVVDTLPPSSAYELTVCLRANKRFAYKSLWMVVEQQWDSPASTHRDTIQVTITGDSPLPFADGLTFWQKEHPLPLLCPQDARRCRIRLYHIMRLEHIHNLCDVGVRVLAKGKRQSRAERL